MAVLWSLYTSVTLSENNLLELKDSYKIAIWIWFWTVKHQEWYHMEFHWGYCNTECFHKRLLCNCCNIKHVYKDTSVMTYDMTRENALCHYLHDRTHLQTQMNSSTQILCPKNKWTHQHKPPTCQNPSKQISTSHFLSRPLSELMRAHTSNVTTIPQAVHHTAFTSLSLNVNSHPLPQTCTCMLHSMLSQKGASANSSTALSVTTWTDFFICCFVMVRLGSIDSTTTHTLSHTIVQAHQKVLWCIWIICMQHMRRLCMTCV